MCTISKTMPALQIATEDIIVYKMVTPFEVLQPDGTFSETRYISYIRDFEYRQNETYFTHLGPFEKVNSDILKEAQLYYSREGFYSWETPRGANVVCIIPKGSKYYKVFCEDSKRVIYTSEAIKIVSMLSR